MTSRNILLYNNQSINYKRNRIRTSIKGIMCKKRDNQQRKMKPAKHDEGASWH